MDFFTVKGENAASFFYVLPYSETEALVEYTRLSSDVWKPEAYDPFITTYLKSRFDVSDFEIIDEEFGVIPMTDFPYEQKPHPRIFQIGTVGGDTKHTTGYTLHFIQKHAQKIIREMFTRGKAQPAVSRFKFYDGLLLRIIIKHPEKTAGIMYRLFKYLPLSLVFKFLDERTNLLEEAYIFSVLPKFTFLKALFGPKPDLYERKPQVPMDTAFRRAR